MKNKLLIIATAVFGFIACEGFGTVEIDAILSKVLNVKVKNESEITAANLKSTAESGYFFYEADTINLADNKDIKEHLDKINELEVYKVTCNLSGLTKGQVINELTIFSTTTGLSLTLYNITEFNIAIEVEASAAELKAISDYLLQYEELVVGVSGYASDAPLDFIVELSYETKAKAGLF